MSYDSLSEVPYKWTTNISASIEDETSLKFKDVWEANDERLPVQARLMDTTVNRNKWRVPENEIDNIISQISAGIPIKLDHDKSEKALAIIGKFEEARKEVNEGGITEVYGKGFINDRVAAKAVWDGTARNISIDGNAPKQSCTKCGTNMLGRKTCSKCGNTEKNVSNWTMQEISLVDKGAYPNAEILPFQFSAALDQRYNEQSELSANKDLEASLMDEEDKKKMEAMEKELKEYKAKCKAMEEGEKKKEEEAKAAEEEEEKKKKDEEAKAGLEKELNESRAKIEELKANLVKNAGATGGMPDPETMGTTNDVIGELSAHLDKYGEKNPFSLQG